MLTEHVLVIQLNRSDDVVIACQDVPAGTVLDEYGLTVRDAVPAGHKIALRNITSGQPVRRYDQIIGFASEPIAAGQHVHVHNLRVQSFERDYAFCADAKPTANDAATVPSAPVSARASVRRVVMQTPRCRPTMFGQPCLRGHVWPALPGQPGLARHVWSAMPGQPAPPSQLTPPGQST